jgi:hypothetical protein
MECLGVVSVAYWQMTHVLCCDDDDVDEKKAFPVSRSGAVWIPTFLLSWHRTCSQQDALDGGGR